MRWHLLVIDCKRLFHTKCIQNGGVLQLPCTQQHVSADGGGRRKRRKHPRVPYDKAPVPSAATSPSLLNQHSQSLKESTSSVNSSGKFSLTGTSEFTDSTDKIISDAKELQLMQDFINKKVSVVRFIRMYRFHPIFQSEYTGSLSISVSNRWRGSEKSSYCFQINIHIASVTALLVYSHYDEYAHRQIHQYSAEEHDRSGWLPDDDHRVYDGV